MRAGLGLIAAASLLVVAEGFLAPFGVGGGFWVLAVFSLLGGTGAILALVSTFLPREKRDRPRFTEELLGREKLQYGVFTEGNWISVLDEKAKKKESKK